jgi:hypothetical protein
MTPLSIAHLPPGGPAWLFALVVCGLVLHIGAAGVAIVSGYAAILARKGGRLHRSAGLWFVLAMTVMGIAAACLAIGIRQRGNVAGGVLAVYLAATAWAVVRRPPGRIGRFETGAFLVAAGIALFMAGFGVEAALSPTRTLDGYPAGPHFGLAALAAFFAWGDFRMIRRGGLSGTPRLARHVGRMGLALAFVAAFFFIGRQKVMPVFMQGSPMLLVLGLAPLVLTIFWLVRIRVAGRRRAASGLAQALS